MLCPSGLAGVTEGWNRARVSDPWEMSLIVLPRLPVRDCHSKLALGNAVLGNRRRKIRLDKLFYPSNVTLSSQ